MMAYGYLWCVNNEPGTPNQYSPERAAHEARKHLRGMLTTEQRGHGINDVLPIVRAAPPAQPAEQQAQTVCKRTLIEIDARLRECSIVGASAADAYDTFYQHMVETALAAQPAEPVQRLSDAGIEALAGKHGTTYRNRHFPTQPAFSFSNGSLHRFVRDIESALQPGWRPEWPAFVEYWTHESHLQTFADRERFRAAAKAMLEAAPKATK